jgi:polyferredoxin
MPWAGYRERLRVTLPRAVLPLLVCLALVVFVVLVVNSKPLQVSDYDRILNIVRETGGWHTLSAIFWIVLLVVFVFWLKAGLTLSKFRLVTQFFFWGLLNTFFFFGQPLITPIILPVLQCNHLNTNSANCLFGPFMRGLTIHMPVPLYFPFAALGSFLLAAVLLGRVWCGWVCPVGLFADILTYVRQWFLKAERWHISQSVHDRLIYVKYGLLATLFLFAMSIGLAELADPLVGQAYAKALPEGLRYEPDCMLCPAPAIFAFWPMVLIPTIWTFGVNPDWLSRLGTLIATSWTYFVVSILFVVFSLFIPRVFCRYFCWVRAMSNLVAKFSPIGIYKDVKACKACRTCQRVCPMMVSQIMDEKDSPRISEPECDNCLLCVESCPERNLRLLVGKWRFLPLFPGQ